MKKRLFVSDLVKRKKFPLKDDEKKYLLKVLRLEDGDGVELFDGSGNIALSKLRIRGNVAWVEVVERERVPSPFKIHLTIGLSAIRVQNFEWALIKCNELMVETIIPFFSKYTISTGREKRIIDKIDRFKKLVIESSRQCGRNYLLYIKNLRGFSELLSEDDYDFKILLDVGGKKGFYSFLNSKREELFGKKILCLIGPEGGWSVDEIEMAKKKNFLHIKFGNSILKSETAAVAVASSFYLFFYS